MWRAICASTTTCEKAWLLAIEKRRICQREVWSCRKRELNGRFIGHGRGTKYDGRAVKTEQKKFKNHSYGGQDQTIIIRRV